MTALMEIHKDYTDVGTSKSTHKQNNMLQKQNQKQSEVRLSNDYL